MQFRIGDRDPVTGLYDVIWPDGSATRNGIKIFNSAHEFGDVVLATKRSDGMMILDGVKATLTEVVTNSFGLGGFGEKPVGYLNGQVFNNEEEVILPTVSIEFAPGSPAFLARGQGIFTVRISLLRIQDKDLDFYLDKLTGTATRGIDYTMSADPTRKITLLAGQQYKDIFFTPTGQKIDSVDMTAVLKLKPDSRYRIGKPSVTLTINHSRFGYRIHKVAEFHGSLGEAIPWSFVEFAGDLTTANLAAYEAAWLATRTSLFMYSLIFLNPGDYLATQPGRVNYPAYPIRNSFAQGSNSDYGSPEVGGLQVLNSVYREDYDIYA